MTYILFQLSNVGHSLIQEVIVLAVCAGRLPGRAEGATRVGAHAADVLGSGAVEAAVGGDAGD